jgi:RimJ/RimL family protein N-acetyltransferase
MSRMLSTCRLTFEPLRESHADELYDGFGDQATYRFIPGQPPMSIEAMRREYREFIGGAPAGSGEAWLNWAVRESASGALAGKLQATHFPDGLLWVGYMFIPSTGGRGLATEAVQWLVVELARRFPGNAPLAAVDVRNGESIRVLQKSGFKLLRTEAAEIHGEPSEDFIFQCPVPPGSEA